MSVRMQQRKLTIDTHVAQEGYGVATAEATAAGTDGMVDMKDWLARSNPSVRFYFRVCMQFWSGYRLISRCILYG